MAAKQELNRNFNNLNNQEKTTRLFEVSRFGIYNSDCAKPTPTGPDVIPVFVYNNKPINPQMVYFIDYSGNMVISLNKETGYKFTYTNGKPYSLCAFVNNKVYFCNKNSFNQTTEKSENHFEVNNLSAEADNLLDLKKALEI